MFKNLNSHVLEVQTNGYLKVSDFISTADASSLESETLKAFKNAKKDFYHTRTDFVKVLSVNKEASKVGVSEFFYRY